MTQIIAIFFPIIATVSIFKSFPAGIDSDCKSPEKSFSRALTKKEEFYYSISLISLLIISGFIFWLLQNSLFKMIPAQNMLFSNRASDIPTYSILVSFFMGMLFGALAWYHIAKKVLGEKKFTELLSASQQGIPLMNQYKWLPRVSFMFGIVFTLLNWSVYNTFLMVDQNSIYFSKWHTPISTEVKVNEIEKITIYELRKAPNGKIRENPYIEFTFTDQTKLDTFYLIEDFHIPEVIDTLKTVKNNNLKIEYTLKAP